MIKLKRIKDEKYANELLGELFFHYQNKEYSFCAKNYAESTGAYILYGHRVFMVKDLKKSEWESVLTPGKSHKLIARKPIIGNVYNQYRKIFRYHFDLRDFSLSDIRDIEKILEIIKIHIKKSADLRDIKISLSHFPMNFEPYKTLNIIDKLVDNFEMISYPQNNKTENKIISLAIADRDDFEQLQEVVLMRKNELTDKAKVKDTEKSKSKKKPDTIRKNKSDSGLLLYKNDNSEYFYNNKKIDIQINTIYFTVFDIIYSYCDQDGFISYGDIESKLVDLGMPTKDEPAIRNKRINNSILNTQGFFRYARINGNRLENKTLDNKNFWKLSEEKA